MRHAPTKIDMVVDALTAGIADGTFPPGSHLPSIADMCSIFQVSEITIREALRRLQTAGRIHRRQGTPPLVLSPGTATTTTGRWSNQQLEHALQRLQDLTTKWLHTLDRDGSLHPRAIGGLPAATLHVQLMVDRLYHQRLDKQE